MSRNTSLHGAKSEKNDEFYTSLSDIEREVKHYRKHFKGKVVYCNCDEPEVSMFHWHFRAQFENLGLKALITSCYKSINPKSRSKHDAEQGWMRKYVAGKNGKPRLKFDRQLKDNGDFRKAENIALLKQADIVVTNPPFSLFREFVAQLVAHKKKFLIIGSMNAVTYKEIFPLIKKNKMWLGNGFQAGNAYFSTPNARDFAAGVYNKETGLVKFRNACWFTNLSHKKRKEELQMPYRYEGNKSDYPVYDNYDAIEVSRVKEIPCDYEGYMGVPITFLDKYNPDQFEIIGIDRPLIYELTGKVSRFHLSGKEIYARLIIKHRNPERRSS